MMASKLPRVVQTCHEGGFGPWFELDWTGRPNHSMALCHACQECMIQDCGDGTADCEIWVGHRHVF
ncbi:hypothetical protein TIFTF001_023114 [Ficus carica]|uniref:Uncharacterized protein n=1 Tax=Ficus carica TaxID=3494 RepID=A0AA88DDG0_FICCA|nr:hypothetical protein TIFTF001_023114 [Ficus carica]